MEANITTIAYKAGILAADTRVISGDLIEQGETRKIFRFKNGTLLGFAGDMAEIQQVVYRLRKNPDGEIKIRNGSLHAIKVLPDGTVYELDDGGWSRSDNCKFYATGSGRVPALVAMRCGKSAIEAVKIAMDFDPHTGGKVQSVRLREKA